ncbi:MAG: hypothetical protein H0T92_02730 [Pyrinomonadaceae bacterium]|nr:hypothetical protein [Pyrinomonadaceae bacterium]
MINDQLHHAAELMREQTVAYRRLDAATAHLAASLVQGTPEAINALVSGGESELLKMRARLARLIGELTAFADARGPAPEHNSVSQDARVDFEAASSDLLLAARDFERTRHRAISLATIGTAFAGACIETCGVPPTTYRAPYTRLGESSLWE